MHNLKQKKIVQRHFDAYAATWHDRLLQYPFYTRMKNVASMIDGITVKAVLDVGCGTGDYATLFPAGKNVYYGLDTAEKMINKCRTLYPGYHFYVGDCENTGMPDAHFDLVLSIAVMEYLLTPDRHVSEVSRILRQDGFCIFALQNRDEITRERDRRAKEIIAPLSNLKRRLQISTSEAAQRAMSENGTEYVKDPRVFHTPYSEKDITDMCRPFGLAFAESRYVNLKLLPAITGVSAVLNRYLCPLLRHPVFKPMRRRYATILLMMMKKIT